MYLQLKELSYKSFCQHLKHTGSAFTVMPVLLRVNSLKRYSKGGNGKNEEFDQIWWKVLWHDGKTPRHSGPAWGGPWGILWGKIFFPDFWNFWNFFFQNALSQAWLIWPMWNLDMFWRQHEILIWRKKILKFRKFVKTTFFFIAFCQMAHFEAEYILRIKFKVYHGKVQT